MNEPKSPGYRFAHPGYALLLRSDVARKPAETDPRSDTIRHTHAMLALRALVEMVSCKENSCRGGTASALRDHHTDGVPRLSEASSAMFK